MIMDGAERIYFAHVTDDWQAGQQAHRSPQHITFVPPLKVRPALAVSIANEVAAGFAPFYATVGEREYFGPKGDIEVYLVEPVNLLKAVQTALLKKLASKKVDVAGLKFINEDYRPHITVKPGHNNPPQTGRRLAIDHLAVMHKDRHYRTMLSKEYFKP